VEQSTAGSRTLRVDLIVDMTSVGFENDGDLRVAELHVAVYCGDAKEKVIGQSQQRWTLRTGDYTLAEWRKNGMDRSVRVEVPVIPKYVKVVVYDPISDRTGSATATIK